MLEPTGHVTDSHKLAASFSHPPTLLFCPLSLGLYLVKLGEGFSQQGGATGILKENPLALEMHPELIPFSL